MRTIVGVVEDNHHGSLDAEFQPEMFFSIRQSPPGFASLVVRTLTDPNAAVPAIERAVRSVAPNVPLADIVMMEQRVAQSTGRPRALATLVGAFAVVAVSLAGLGLYGVLSYVVGQRTSEIGLRLALGGNPVSILRLFLRQSANVVIPGVVIGLTGALVARQAIAGLLFGIEPLDFPSYVGATVVMLLIAGLGTYVPARRAMRVDPMTSLRTE